MKKTVLLSLLLCLILGSVLGFVFAKDGLAIAAETTEPVTSEEPAEAEESAGRLDFEALYALHEPDEIVMTVGEREVSWGEYFYYLFRQATTVENYFDSMAANGTSCAWGDALSEDDPATFLDYALESTDNTVLSISAMDGFARSVGAALSDENREAIAAKAEADYVAACGEEATREDFEEFLKTIYMPSTLYDYMNETSVLFQEAFRLLYGENGEKLPDEDAIAWLEDNEYMAANHILFMTLDTSTYQTLDEETCAEKLAQAQTVAEELRAIEDQEELLARFAALKEELDEDSGKLAYPNGYVFTPGKMVSEFEEAVKAQEAYQVSEPVESAYGYHVIMTLPLDPDAVIEYSSAGTPMTARAIAASETYTARVDAYAEEQAITWREGYEAPDLLAFVK